MYLFIYNCVKEKDPLNQLFPSKHLHIYNNKYPKIDFIQLYVGKMQYKFSCPIITDFFIIIQSHD